MATNLEHLFERCISHEQSQLPPYLVQSLRQRRGKVRTPRERAKHSKTCDNIQHRTMGRAIGVIYRLRAIQAAADEREGE